MVRAIRAVLALLLVGASPGLAQSQAGSVSGVVVDDQGRPVVAARVSVVNQTATTVTDNAGRFRLEVSGGPDVTLRVAAIGYRPYTQGVRVGDASVRLVLVSTPVNLSELIVTGTAGAVERRSIGNSVTKIDASAAAEVAPIRTVAQLLNGRATGVVLTANSGMAGGGSKISIRGRNSLSLPTQPLLYVDGVRVDNAQATGPTAVQGANVVSRLNDINPNDIESIEIIKGPAAATLYGTEASNGVIQIITKSGRAGEKPRFGISVEEGTNAFMDPEGRIPTNYMVLGPNGPTAFNYAQAETDRGTPIWRTGRFQRYQLSADGGTGTTAYHVSTSLTRDQGVDRDNDLSQVGALATLSFAPRPNFTVKTNFGLTSGRTNLSTQEGISNIFSAINALPVLKDGPTRGSLFAPHEVLSEVYDVFQLLRRVTGGVQLHHQIGEHFSQRLVVGADFVGENDQVLIQRMTPDQARFFSPDDAKGRKAVRLRDASSTTFDYSGTFRTGKSALTSNTTVGAQYFSRFARFTQASGAQFPALGLQTVNGTAIRTGGDDYIENTTVGVFAQQQFGWRNRLFLTGAVRGDDNSAFGKNFNFVVYPKVSASWVVNEEPFWHLNFINSFKLRAAYGAAGQQPDAFAALRTFQPVTGPGNQPTLTTQSVGNPDLKPERGEELEVGFEAGLLNQRVTVDFTYYRQTRKDAILLAPVPPSGGFIGTQFVNAGKIQNRGAELQVSAQIINRQNFGWDLTANVATNSNKIADLGGQPPLLVGVFPLAQQHVLDYPVAAYWGQRIVSATLGANGQVSNLMCDTDSGTPVSCAGAPKVYLGRSTPKYEGAFTSTLTLFDKFRVYAMVDFKSGHKRFDTNLWARCTVFRMCEQNASPEKFDAVTNAYAQRGSSLQLIDGFVGNASFAKLREVSVSYEMPTSLVRSLGASRGSLSLAGRNLHTWTKWTGLDPELEDPGTFGQGSSSEQGLLPVPVQFRFSISLAF